MSESLEETLWHGVPIRSVRSARFIDKDKNTYTVRRLVVNGTTLIVSDQAAGSVAMDASYLNWAFRAPKGAFSPEDFDGYTISELFDAIRRFSAEHPVEDWEKFAAFLAGAGEQLTQLFDVVRGAVVSAPGLASSIAIMEVPTWSAPESFTELLSWIIALLPQALLAQSCAVLQADIEGAEYTFSVTLELEVNTGQGTTHEAMSVSFLL